MTDWLGGSFSIPILRSKCMIQRNDKCMKYKCYYDDSDMFKKATENTKWKMDDDDCDLHEKTLKCPQPLPIKSTNNDFVQSPPDFNTYKTLFEPACKIRDMCYRSIQTKRDHCDNQFKDNMEVLCELKHPHGDELESVWHRGKKCKDSADYWYNLLSSTGKFSKRSNYNDGIDVSKCVADECKNGGNPNDGYDQCGGEHGCCKEGYECKRVLTNGWRLECRPKAADGICVTLYNPCDGKCCIKGFECRKHTLLYPFTSVSYCV
mmetsp:Transcript_23645/g.20704  ORF Transcript_23645/g.20704 Transcript_23645/m.20704 type:complete len:263 (+) Transcript_23645:314-1102(+)